ncbi:MAG: hypothetical protein JO307_13715 [Bryobacterales bacterium]|nr:hypothetical protein [Bryobacterales bacterium]
MTLLTATKDKILGHGAFLQGCFLINVGRFVCPNVILPDRVFVPAGIAQQVQVLEKGRIQLLFTSGRLTAATPPEIACLFLRLGATFSYYFIRRWPGANGPPVEEDTIIPPSA